MGGPPPGLNINTPINPHIYVMELLEDILIEILEERYSDPEFLAIIREMDTEVLPKLHEMISTEVRQIRDAIKQSITKFRRTGVPDDPLHFQAMKYKLTIRAKQKLMVEHQIKKRK